MSHVKMSQENEVIMCDHHAENLILRELIGDLEMELDEGVVQDALVQIIIERDEEITRLKALVPKRRIPFVDDEGGQL